MPRQVSSFLVALCLLVVCYIFLYMWKSRLDDGHLFLPQSNCVDMVYNITRWRSPCPIRVRLQEKIGLLLVSEENYAKRYERVLKLWKCYSALHGYQLFHFSIASQETWEPRIYFKKVQHAREALQKVDYLLVLDLDMIITNLSVTIEEIIDSRYDLLLIDRDDTIGEIFAGSYIIHRSEWSFRFLDDWIALEKWCVNGKLRNADNGALHLLLLRYFIPSTGENVLPEEYGISSMPCTKEFIKSGESWNDYYSAVKCFRRAFGSSRSFPGRIRILPPWMGWFRLFDYSWTEDIYKKQITDDWVLHTKEGSIPRILTPDPHPFEICDIPALKQQMQREDLIVNGGVLEKMSNSDVRKWIHAIARKNFSPDHGEWTYYYRVAECFPTCSELLLMHKQTLALT